MRVAHLAAIVLLWLLFSGVVAGHGEDSSHGASGPSMWDAAAMAAIILGGALYAAGTLRLRRRGARVRGVEQVAFWAGWATMLGAVAPPMDAAAAAVFSMHMAQHELLIVVGAPLMIVGRPIAPWLWAVPAFARPSAAYGLRMRPISNAWNALTSPAIAWAIHGAVVWVWHAPALYSAAVGSEAVHALQHATFVATAVLFWWGLVYGRYGRAAYGASALFVFITTLHTGILGALFALSSAPYYPIYETRAEALGVDPLADQQLAGLYMWIPSGIVLTMFGLALVLAWLSQSERRGRAARQAH